MLQKTCTPPSGTLPGANAWDCKTSTCGCGISQGQFCHTTCKDGFYLSFADVKFPVLRAFLEKKIKGPIFICTPLFFGCPTNILVGKCGELQLLTASTVPAQSCPLLQFVLHKLFMMGITSVVSRTAPACHHNAHVCNAHVLCDEFLRQLDI